MPIRILLADDSKIIRDCVTNLLADYPVIEVVCEASTFAETLKLAEISKPDLVLIDLHMPDSGLLLPQAFKELLERCCGAKVLAMSFAVDEESHALAESFGSLKFLDKMRLAEDLIPTILAAEKFASEKSEAASL